jgi:hypothetical protein
MNCRSQTYGVGKRCDLPAGAVHSARMGPHGCRYLIGERSRLNWPQELRTDCFLILQ